MEQQLSLDELLHRCTARLSVPNGHGTGFFVAPRLILTCAHVVEITQTNKTLVTVDWNSQSYIAKIVEYRTDPDLALLEIDLANHPCVFLSQDAKPFSKLYSYGYPTDYSNGAAVTFEVEGLIGDQKEHLKFKEGQVQPGMSGAALLNWETGGVCGIVQFTRGRSSAIGGDGLLTKKLVQEFSELKDLQQKFHKQDRRWYDCLTGQQRQIVGLEVPSPTFEVFCLYADVEADKKMLAAMEDQLSTMQKRGLITTWHKDKMKGGSKRDEINEHLERAKIILLLVSPNFMASYYRDSTEVEQVMKRINDGVRVIPVILRPTDYRDAPFEDLRPFPKNGRAISRQNRDEAFLTVAQGLREVVEQLKENS